MADRIFTELQRQYPAVCSAFMSLRTNSH
jgi:hypothetical protein